jgi:membrane protein
LVRLTRSLLAVLTLTGGLGILYHVGANRRPPWRSVWPGALFATLFWFLFTWLFAFYVQNVARYSDFYGSVATVVVLLVWMFLVNCIVMIGCEFNAERERWRHALAWERPEEDSRDAAADATQVAGR